MVAKRNELVRREFLKATGGAVALGSLASLGTGGAQAQTGSYTAENPLEPNVLVLPAFEVGDFKGDTAGEFQLWYENYDLNEQVDVPGTAAPLFISDDGLAVTPTGIGKSQATTTVTSLLAAPNIDFDNTIFVSAGIAGTPPDVGTLGSVFLSDYVVDWDLSHRWSRADGPADPHAMIKLDPDSQKYYKINEDLLALAQWATSGTSLAISDRAVEYRQLYDEQAAQQDPSIGVGTTVCGDEYWHGSTFSDQATWLCSDVYDTGMYSTTEMEDYGTATALARHGHLDRYLSIRSVSNFDQPHPNQTVEESLTEANSGGFGPSITNVFRVGSEVVDTLLFLQEMSPELEWL
jgi:purine nucleoside permease